VLPVVASGPARVVGVASPEVTVTAPFPARVVGVASRGVTVMALSREGLKGVLRCDEGAGDLAGSSVSLESLYLPPVSRLVWAVAAALRTPGKSEVDSFNSTVWRTLL